MSAQIEQRLRYRSGMKLTDDRVPGINLISAYAPGEIRIGATVLQRSCLICTDRIVSNWQPQTLNALSLAHLEAVVALEPEIVILGSGSRQRFPDMQVLASLLSRGIGCEVMDTGAACRTFNILINEDRRAVAALFLQDD